MLGKQWLNRYESTEMRGSATERSQNRQQKLDGIVAWYFHYVMESLPLMLQAALFLLGCALSRYLWSVDSIVALVVLGITSFGAIFYVLIIVAGATSESCPYQTPGSQFLRYLARKFRSVLTAIAPALGNAFRKTTKTIAFNQLHGAFPTPEQRSTWRIAVLDLRCVSWTLQTSLDKAVRLSALKHLMSSMLEFTGFDSTLAVDCFGAFIACISVSNERVVITQGLDKLATVSAGCFCRAFHRLSITDPTSSVLADLRRRYVEVFPVHTDFTDLRSCHTITMTHAVVTGYWDHWSIVRDDDRPSNLEHILIARVMAEVAQANYQQNRSENVPHRILRFAFDSLSLDPLPPASVVANCFKTIAIDLGCDISNVATLDQRYMSLSVIIVHLLTKNQCAIGGSLNSHHPEAHEHD